MSPKLKHSILLLLVTTASHVVSYFVETLPGPLSTIGEGPVWDIDRQFLYFVDIHECAILRYDPVQNRTYKAIIDGVPFVSAIVLIRDKPDHFVLGTGNTLSLVQWDGFSEKASFVQTVADLGDSESHVRFNDAKVDRQGRLYIGTMRRETVGEPLGNSMVGKLYRFDGRIGGQLIVQRSGVGMSNGITWNEKLGKFYYIDSLALNIKEYDVAANGDLYNEQVLLSFVVNGTYPGFYPDGMTCDSEGNLYVATWFGSRVLKINAKEKRVEQEMWIPTPQVTSVSFGGPCLDKLYVTTAKTSAFDNDLPPGAVLSRPPIAGALFKLNGLNVKGCPMHKMILNF